MDLVIINGDFNDKEDNNDKCIEFSIQYTVINTNIEGRYLIIRATFLLSSKPLISCDTLLNRCSCIIIFQESEGFEIYPSDIL